SEDVFIEMERSLKTVVRAMPDVVEDKDVVRDALLNKYKTGVIDNIVDFRKIGKIARSAKVGVSPQAAKVALDRLFTEPTYTISDAWESTASEAYAERDVVTRIEHLLDRLASLKPGEIDEDVREKLQELIERAE